MPRDPNGNYTPPASNPVEAGTVITSEWANSTVDDISSALTNSLSRNGAGGMLSALLHLAGTQLAPGISFTQQASTGMYLAALNDLRITVAGVDVFRWLNTGQVQVWQPDPGVWLTVLTDTSPAASVAYDNAVSQLTATTVQDAIDELTPPQMTEPPTDTRDIQWWQDTETNELFLRVNGVLVQQTAKKLVVKTPAVGEAVGFISSRTSTFTFSTTETAITTEVGETEWFNNVTVVPTPFDDGAEGGIRLDADVNVLRVFADGYMKESGSQTTLVIALRMWTPDKTDINDPAQWEVINGYVLQTSSSNEGTTRFQHTAAVLEAGTVICITGEVASADPTITLESRTLLGKYPVKAINVNILGGAA